MLRTIEINTFQNRKFKQEYSRLLSAAVINSGFRKMLLKDPTKAVSSGYSGEKFKLSRDAEEKLGTIQANSLQEFAAKLASL